MQPPPPDRIAEALERTQTAIVGIKTARAQLKALDRYLSRLEQNEKETEKLLAFLIERYPTLKAYLTTDGGLTKYWDYDP